MWTVVTRVSVYGPFATKAQAEEWANAWVHTSYLVKPLFKPSAKSIFSLTSTEKTDDNSTPSV